MAVLSPESRFAPLGAPHSIWVIGAVCGQNVKLAALHDAMGRKFVPGDRLVYLGNIFGGPKPCECVDEVLSFRRALLAKPGVLPEDIVFLRGAQEEMLQKSLQLQFAQGPAQVMDWMLSRGLASTLAAYGFTPQQAMGAARDGVMGLTRWAASVREAIRRHPGHAKFLTVLRRAAFTGTQEEPGPLLFVHAGVDPAHPLAAQGEALWWGHKDFAALKGSWHGFSKIIRGADPEGQGRITKGFIYTLDAGSVSGGPLTAAHLSPAGKSLAVLEI